MFEEWIECIEILFENSNENVALDNFLTCNNKCNTAAVLLVFNY